MIDQGRLREILVHYKASFQVHWRDEKGQDIEAFKWRAIQTFQDNWDIDAEDFRDMLVRALADADHLLTSGFAYPKTRILDFAKADAEGTRAMFRKLFDEGRPLVERVRGFQEDSEVMLGIHDNGTWKKHDQSTNAISKYLWLWKPDTYYVYMYSIYRSTAKALSSDYAPKRDGSPETMIAGFRMLDEIAEDIRQDSEVAALLEDAIGNSKEFYPDPQLKTTAFDVAFYIHAYYPSEARSARDDDAWFPSEYFPGLTVERWAELLADPEIFTDGSLRIMKRMRDYGGQATCTQLAVRYGGSVSFYYTGSWTLGRRVAEEAGCAPYLMEDGKKKYWPVLYTGKPAGGNDSGVYVWRLRQELSEALDGIDLSDVPLYEESAPTIWKISHGTFATSGITDEQKAALDARNVVAVHGETKALANAKVPQGQTFLDAIRKGDYFYLCNGNDIQLLGQFDGEDAEECPELGEGWYERFYRLIARTDLSTPYTGQQKWWTPNSNFTCVQVKKEEEPLFEDLILKPWFHMTLEGLFADTNAPFGYWWLNASPKIWSFEETEVGKEESYSLYNDDGNKRHVFQNFLDAKAGDPIICYTSTPVKQIVALGRVTKETDGDQIWFEKTEDLTVPVEYADLKDCPELAEMECFASPRGTLFRLTEDEYTFLMGLIRESNPEAVSQKPDNESYTRVDFLSDVYMVPERYDLLTSLLKHKLNVILQGAPGVGKTFAARRLAWSIMGERDDKRVKVVQFHQNYSYEDFIQGYRPEGDGFILKDGVFKRFCDEARSRPDQDFFFIIDEINRGNLSKIFGELLMLIEKDYRGDKGEAALAYTGRPFTVPENLYIIGMMNTADRSLAMIDYALRRRFSFFPMEPGFSSEGFQAYQASFDSDVFDELVGQIRQLNQAISDDPSLGPGFQIGHSYLCGREPEDGEEWLQFVVEFDILPQLEEYWYDEPKKVEEWSRRLRGVFHDV